MLDAWPWWPPERGIEMDQLAAKVRERRAAVNGNVWWLNGDIIDCWSFPTAAEADAFRANRLALGYTVYDGQSHPIHGGFMTVSD